MSMRALTERIASQYGITLNDIPLFRDNRAGCCDGTGCEHCRPSPCERCGSHERVEVHHWAPSYLFDDSHLWPMSTLCRKCHTRWHRIVTPKMHLREAG